MFKIIVFINNNSKKSAFLKANRIESSDKLAIKPINKIVFQNNYFNVFKPYFYSSHKKKKNVSKYSNFKNISFDMELFEKKFKNKNEAARILKKINEYQNRKKRKIAFKKKIFRHLVFKAIQGERSNRLNTANTTLRRLGFKWIPFQLGFFPRCHFN
jgi:hypothetical protein